MQKTIIQVINLVGKVIETDVMGDDNYCLLVLMSQVLQEAADFFDPFCI